MKPTAGEMDVMRYIVYGLGIYHLAVTRRERGVRDRIIRRLILRRWIDGDLGKPWRLNDEGRVCYEKHGGPPG